MSCKKCKQKGIGIVCKYCFVEYCTSCIQLEIHGCPGLHDKIKEELTYLQKILEFKKDRQIKD